MEKCFKSVLGAIFYSVMAIIINTGYESGGRLHIPSVLI